MYGNGHHLYHDLSKTIEELSIDDYPPALTTEEKQATVGDLIKARSGIYHAAVGESPGMKAMRPERHSHRPGTFWYYNNWDFNVKDHSYYASGWGGHKIFVLPYRNLVIVHRVNTDRKGKMVAEYQIGRLLWHILDAAGESEIGEKPILDGARGVRLTGKDLYTTLADSEIRTDRLTARFLQDNRLELWVKDKRIDAGKWWVKKDKFWLKAKILTSGRKVCLDLVLAGDTIKWYDPEGTLGGKGDYSRIN